jgi:hypothetical protein
MLWTDWSWPITIDYLVPVKKGEPGYEEAPYEETFIQYRDVWSIECTK